VPNFPQYQVVPSGTTFPGSKSCAIAATPQTPTEPIWAPIVSTIPKPINKKIVEFAYFLSRWHKPCFRSKYHTTPSLIDPKMTGQIIFDLGQKKYQLGVDSYKSP